MPETKKDSGAECGIYLHIPFCVLKCRYCDFLSAPAAEETKEDYVRVLLQEIKEKAPAFQNRTVTSVFFGGGTPSILKAGAISNLMDQIRTGFAVSDDAEITIECNPGTLTREKLAIYKGCGINRLSMGVQSADNAVLKMLGRIHTYEAFLESFELARKAGFKNINLDIISGLPLQKEGDYEKSLKKLLRLRPEHLSVYSLLIEEGTEFYRLYGEDAKIRENGGKPQFLPEEEAERRMVHRTAALLAESGYQQYEISNFARKGRESRHNLGYWRRSDYLGLGLGAASLVDNHRFHNTRALDDYLKYEFSPQEEEVIDKKGQMEETMFLGLREIRGVEKAEFYRRFGVSMRNVYGKVIDEMSADGLLMETEQNVCLSTRGLDVANYVMAAFLLD
ncbi:MAG: oxygen-independent coproporphyrinogen III oxidase [Lachnospiraceae bacterium]|nr:oxygen-independent coproporphyrinogen III oxidase [Lachnospiraceae bacterium]